MLSSEKTVRLVVLSVSKDKVAEVAIEIEDANAEGNL